MESPNAQIPGRNGVPEYAWEVVATEWKVEKLASVTIGGKGVVIPEVISYVVSTAKNGSTASSEIKLTVNVSSICQLTPEEREPSAFRIRNQGASQ